MVKIFCIGSLFFMLICQSCTSTGAVDDTIAEHQREVVRLEGRVADLTARLSKYDSAVTASVERLTTIQRRTDGAIATVDELISLFRSYDEEVQRLVKQLNDLQSTSGSGAQSSVLAPDNSGG